MRILIPGISYLCVYFFFAFASIGSASGQDEIEVRIKATTTNGLASYSNTVALVRPESWYIPNSFSPNGDGLNDLFEPKFEGIAYYDLKVFDRWGNLIFKSNNVEQAWNGNIKGQPAPSNMYVYELLAVNTSGRELYRNGNLFLIRD